MTIYDLIVVGGGVSGIAAAARAGHAGQRVLLLEAADRLGGCVETWRPEPDFWLELGAHTAYNSYGALLELAPDDEYRDLVRRAKVGYHFFHGGRVQSPMARLGWFEAARHLPFGLSRSKVGQTLEDYYSHLLGPGNWRRLLAPAFAAVLSQPAGEYPAEWLFRRKPRVKEAPRKFTHADGLQGWLESLLRAAGVELCLGRTVSELVEAPDHVTLNDARARENWHARRVVLAVPAPVAGRLLTGTMSGLGDELVADLAATPMAEIETLAVVVPARAVRLPPLAGLIGGDDCFYSAVSRDYLPHPLWRGFAFHFKPGALDTAGRRRKAAEVLGCREENFIHLQEKTNRLPRLTPASVRLAASLETVLDHRRVRLAGNYLNGMSLGDAAQHAADGVDVWLGEPV